MTLVEFWKSGPSIRNIENPTYNTEYTEEVFYLSRSGKSGKTKYLWVKLLDCAGVLTLSQDGQEPTKINYQVVCARGKNEGGL